MTELTPPAQGIHRTGVDLGGLMSVLSRHLYSTPMVALRELVQNAHDSILRRRLEQPDFTAPGRIDVVPEAASNTLRIIDTGAGLTEHEVHAYLATVGVGYTRQLRQGGHEESGLIGMFGLGFLSAFVLAKKVSVRTTSYQTPEVGCVYVSSNAEQYSVGPMPARAIGTEIVLELKDEYSGLTVPARLHEILGHYCALLAEPIHIAHEPTAINPEPPPWRPRTGDVVPHPVQQRRAAQEFAARFERSFEPLCTLPVRPREESDAVGLLWVQDGATYGTSDNRNLSVFLRGMLLDDDARDLLPAWAGFVGGVIESSRLTPTASREDLQRDRTYDAVRHALTESLIEGLAELPQQQPEAWRRVLARHNEALLGAALCDDRLFNLLADHLRIPTAQGDLPARALVARGAVHLVLDAQEGFEGMLFRAQGIPVALGHRYAVVPFLRRWAQANQLRCVELGTEQGNRALFQLDTLPHPTLDWLQAHLGDGEQLLPARFAPADLPLVVVPDREGELKRRLEEDDQDRKISQSALRLARQFTARIESTGQARLYLNLDNPAIAAIIATHKDTPERAIAAASLLRAFKTVLAASARNAASEHTQRLGDALRDLSAGLARMTGSASPATVSSITSISNPSGHA